MIELIFALVIMGIVLMSAPMMISTAAKGTYIGMQQEGINEAASKINMILSYVWDEQNTDNEITPPLLYAKDGNDAFKKQGNGTRRGIPQRSSRTFYPDLNASASLGLESGESSTDIDDVDDYNGETITSLLSVESASTDYTENDTVSISTTIEYGDDGYTDGATYNFTPFVSSSKVTNVKNIKVELTSTDTANADVLEKKIVLQAFWCNIGGIKYAEKWF